MVFTSVLWNMWSKRHPIVKNRVKFSQDSSWKAQYEIELSDCLFFFFRKISKFVVSASCLQIWPFCPPKLPAVDFSVSYLTHQTILQSSDCTSWKQGRAWAVPFWWLDYIIYAHALPCLEISHSDLSWRRRCKEVGGPYFRRGQLLLLSSVAVAL